jgi:glycosyltransferase involved in cell wall biosynthesis
VVVVSVIVFLGCISGFILFRKNTVPESTETYKRDERISVIIPARNEEANLPQLLSSLLSQSYQPDEIIVVDDGSEDRTREIAMSYGVKVVDNPELPDGWTGKTWAVWNGFLHSSGDLIVFLDADIRMAPHALESLLRLRKQCGGVISVVPYHYTEKLYERFALVANILGVFAFTSPFERKSKQKGLYGSCIITTRVDYEVIQGHDSIKSEVLDDLNLGARYRAAGIPVTNFLGQGLVSFRMYPNGIKSELQGFGKGAVLSTSKLAAPTIVLVALWLIGLIVAESTVFFWDSSWFYVALIGYVLYTLQIFYLIQYVGKFGKLMPILHILSTLFFLIVMLYSAYQVIFLGSVSWKGRAIQVRGRS